MSIYNKNPFDVSQPSPQITSRDLYDMQMAMNQYKQPTKQEKIAELQRSIKEQTIQLERLTLDDPIPGPTQRELNQHESLRESWEAYCIVRALTLGEKK